HLPANTQARLIWRLINDDHDTETTVTFVDGAYLGLTPVTGASTQTRALPAGERGTIDFDRLADITTSTAAVYTHTSFAELTEKVTALTTLTNTGTYPVRGPLLLGVRNLSDPTVRLADPDVIGPDGTPYYNLSPLVFTGGDMRFNPNDSVPEVPLKFLNPELRPFDYDLVVLGRLNTPPEIVTTPPRNVRQGGTYQYDADATDTDGDPLLYGLSSGPDGVQVNFTTGLITWTTTNVDVGTYIVVIRAIDPFGGVANQQFAVNVAAPQPNHPPIFTSVPPADAFVNATYSYDADADDEDGDPLIYSILEGPEGLTIQASTGWVTWTPDPDLAGQILPVRISVRENLEGNPTGGEEAVQEFEIAVHQDLGNHAPQIISEPLLTHTIAVPANELSRHVTPQRLDLDLLPGTTVDRDVILDVVPVGFPGLIVEPPNRFSVFNETDPVKLLDAILMGGNSGILVTSVNLSAQSKTPLIVVQPISDQQIANGTSLEIPLSANLSAVVFEADSASRQKGIQLTNVNSSWTLNWTPSSTDYNQHHIVSLIGRTFGSDESNIVNFVITVGHPSEPKPNLGLQSQTVASTGIFVNDTHTFGLSRYGIVLSSGNAAAYGDAYFQAPNSTHAEFGVAATSPQQALLSQISQLPPNYTPGPEGHPSGTTNQLIHFDVSELTVTFDTLPGYDTVYFDVVFGSEEYPEFSYDIFQDAFGIFLKDPITGEYDNIAEAAWQELDENGNPVTHSQPISVRHPEFYPHQTTRDLFAGYVAADPESNYADQTLFPHLLEDNPAMVELLAPSPLDGVLAPNGRPVLRFAVPVGAGTTGHELKFLIADTSDALLDSTVYIANFGAVHHVVVDAITNVEDVGFENLSGPQTGLPGDQLTFHTQFTTPEVATAYNVEFVDSNTGLVLGTIPVTVNTAYFYLTRAVDPDGDRLTYRLTDSPSGATIDSATGEVAWVPPAFGDYDFTVRVDDGRGGSDDQSFTVRVSEFTSNNQPPVITSTPGLTAQVGREYAYQTVATDPEGSVLRYFLTQAPAGMQIDRHSGRVSWTPSPGQNLAPAPVRIKVYDTHGGVTEQSFTLTVLAPDVFVNHPPVITSRPPLTAVIDAEYRTTVVATDPDSDPVTFSLVSGPVDAAIDARSGLLVWWPNADDAGDQAFDVMAADNHGGFDRQRFMVSVLLPPAPEDPGVGSMTNSTDGDEQPNRSPQIISTPVTQVKADEQYRYQVIATDPDDDSLFYYLDVVSQNKGIPIDSFTGVIEGVPGASAVGTHEITVFVTDGRGGSDSQTFTVTVLPPDDPQSEAANDAPVVTSQPTGPAYVGETWTYEVEAHDPEGHSLAFSLITAPFDSQGMTVEMIDPGGDGRPGKALVKWTPSAVGNYKVQLWISDVADGTHGTSSEFQLPVTIKNSPPKIFSIPYDPVFVGTEWRYQVLAFDPDGDALTYTVASETPGFSIDNNHLVTWTPTDTTGLVTVTVNVSDGQGGEWEEEIDLAVRDPLLESQRLSVGVPNGQLRPVVTSIHTGPILSGTTWTYQLTAVDPDGDSQALEFSPGQTDVPAPVDVDSTGIVTVNAIDFPATELGTLFSISVVVSDDQGLENLYTFPVRFADWNLQPAITTTPTQQAYLNRQWTYDLDLVDPNGAVDEDRLKFYLDLDSLADGLAIDPDMGIITWTPTATSDLMGRSVTIVASDHAAYDVDNPNSSDRFKFAHNIARQSFTLTVANPEPDTATPRITSLPSATALLDTLYSYQVQTVEPDSQSLTYALTGNVPVGMTISPSGLLTWTPAVLGYHAVSIQVTDPDGNFTTQTYLLADIEPYRLNIPPEITSQAPVLAYRDLEYSYAVQVSDPNHDPLYFALDAAPAGMSISAQGVISWTPTVAGRYSVTFTVSDGPTSDLLALSDRQSFSLLVLQNAPPQITSTPGSQATIGQPYSYTVTATDPNAGDTLSYALDIAPAGAALDPTTHEITWTPTAEQLGRQRFLLIVTDQEGAIAKQTFDVQAIEAGMNYTPVFVSHPRRTLPINFRFTHQVMARDPDGDNLQYSFVSGPAGMTMNNAGLITWTPRAADINDPATPHQITVRVDDARGAFAEQTYSVDVTRTLINDDPEITSNPRRSATLNYTYVSQPTATDPDADLLLWRLEEGPSGMTIDPLTGRIEWKPTQPAELGDHTVRIAVYDPYGGSDQQEFTVTTRGANLAPMISSVPETLAALNELYSYQVQAYDPDEGTITFSLVAGQFPETMQIHATTGLIQWTPSGDPRDVTVKFRVTDDRGGKVDQQYTLHVYDPASNRPPAITSVPPIYAIVGQEFPYAVTATDPNSDPLTFSLNVQSGSVPQPWPTIDAATGDITWVPTQAQVGQEFKLQAVVSDGALSAKQSFKVRVRTNVAPNVDAIANQEIVAGQSFRYDVRASDGDNDPLTYALDAASLARGLTIDRYGRITWRTRPGTPDQGTGLVAVTASDGLGGVATEDFTLTVVADTVAPTVTVSASPSPAVLGQTVTLTVAATDNVGVETLNLVLLSRTYAGTETQLDTPVALNAAGRGQITLNLLGSYLFEATAGDFAGNQGTTSFTLTVQLDTTPPKVKLTTPREGQRITEPITLIGTVDDAEGSAVTYQITVAPVAQSGGNYRSPLVIATGNSEVNNGVLGQFDPTLLPNGPYELTLIGWDSEGNSARVTRTITVEGNLKPGSLNLSFKDLELNTPGIPITVTRNYSTLHAADSLDFGHGWSLELARPRVQVTYPETRQTLYEGDYIPFRDGTRVRVTLPDGTVEGFTFTPYLIVNNGLGFGLGESTYKPYFTPDAGVTSQLWLEDDVTLAKVGDEYLVHGAFSFNPTVSQTHNNWLLITHGGVRLGIDAVYGDRSWIKDRNSNQVTFTDGAITHSNGQRVVIERDQGNRISRIIDPSGHAINYRYNVVTGDLIAVTDRVGSVTRFAYDAEHPHFLDTITDPLERVAAAADYRPDGRLSSLTDAADQHTDYDYNSTSRRQTVRDQFDNAVVVEQDARGNVIREERDVEIEVNGQTVTQQQITTRRFSTRDELLKETTVIGGLDGSANGETDDLTRSFTYDRYGQPLTATDEHGGISRSTYDKYGALLTMVDPLGNSVKNEYDPQSGNLLRTTVHGVTTRFEYDTFGNVTEVYKVRTQAEGGDLLLVRNTYAATTGRLTETYSPASDQTTSFHYDLNGNQDYSYHTVDTTAGGYRMLHETDLDAADRPTDQRQRWELYNAQNQLISSATVSATATAYNPVGQSDRTTDAANLSTETLFDVRGLAIQTRSQGRDSSGQSAWLVTRTVYDDAGRAIYATDAYPEGTCCGGSPDPATVITGTHTIYDAAGRVSETERLTGLTVDVTSTGANRHAELAAAGTLLSASSSTFDAAGRVTSSTDTYGLLSVSRYNNKGDVIETRRQARDENDQVVWIVSRTLFDDKGRVTVQSDPFLSADGSAIPTDGVSATRTVYDAEGRQTQSLRLTGVKLTINAAKNNSVLSQAGTVEWRTKTVYNSQGQVDQSVAADGQVTRYEYDQYGRQTAVIGHAVPVGNQWIAQRTETVYDSHGRRWKDISGLQQIWSFNPNANGVGALGAGLPTPPTIDRSDARTTTFAYDPFGNVERTTSTDGSFTSSRFDDHGRAIADSQPVAAGTTVSWSDTANSFVGVPPSGGASVTVPTKLYHYDPQGRLQAVELPAVPDPLDNNALHRPRYEYGYDANGNQTLIRDPLARETRFTFDDQGRQRTRTLPLGFGEDGRLDVGQAFQPDTLPFTERFEYDTQGRQKLHVSFEGVVTEFVYSTTTSRLSEQRFFDNLTAYNNGQGTPTVVWSFTYDASGRQIEVTQTRSVGGSPATRTVTTGYDAEGRVTRIASPEGTVNYGYDTLGRKTRTWIGTDSSSPVDDMQYGYDALSRLETVSVLRRDSLTLATPEVTTYRYDLLGNLASVTLPNGVVSRYVYDNLNRLTNLTHYAPDTTPSDPSDNATVIESFAYHLRPDGRRDRENDVLHLNGATQTAQIDWTYDDIGRLIAESFDSSDNSLDYTDGYTFDLTGNRLAKTHDAGNDNTVDETTSYQYDANDRLLVETLDRVVGPDTTTSYGYTGTQQTSKSVHDDSANRVLEQTSFGFDLQGRMAVVTHTTFDTSSNIANRETTRFSYDQTGIRFTSRDTVETADGNGQLSVTSDTITDYLNDAQNFTGYSQVIRETTKDASTGQISKTIVYTFGLDAINQTTSTPENPAGTTLFFTHDGHGSVRVLLDAAAAIAAVAGVPQVFHFDAYGNAWGFNPAQVATTKLYNSEPYDPRIGLDYFRGRYYGSQNGLFIGLDPFSGNMRDPQSLHKYLFVHGDPINFVDPTGLMEGGLSGLLTTITAGFRDLNIRVYVSMTGYLAARTLLTKVLVYGSAGLSIYGMYSDPAGYLATGPASMADDLQLLAASTRQFGSRAFAIIKNRDFASRASGMLAKLSPESVNKALGSFTGDVNPTGWKEFTAITTPGQRARGHLLARIFGGPGNWLENLVPIYQSINLEMYHTAEKVVANALKSGKYKFVYYSVRPIYEGASAIPKAIELEAIGEVMEGVYETVVARRSLLNQP
ncbi:MAG: putative Ig domain-containing protein, partial [Planctomycetales bacterium]|nr:putative Ig domain-containing protein [Planctomycetales bacterium]